jgi:hypothetical protein
MSPLKTVEIKAFVPVRNFMRSKNFSQVASYS